MTNAHPDELPQSNRRAASVLDAGREVWGTPVVDSEHWADA